MGRSFAIFTEDEAKKASQARTSGASLGPTPPTQADLEEADARVRPSVTKRSRKGFTTTVQAQGPLMEVPGSTADGRFTSRTPTEINDLPEDHPSKVYRGDSRPATVSDEGIVMPSNERYRFGPGEQKEHEARAARNLATSRNIGGKVYDMTNPEDLAQVSEIKKGTRGWDVAASESAKLDATATNAPEPSFEASLNDSPINAHGAWDALKAAHGVLERHYNSLPDAKKNRANQYDASAKAIEQAAPGHPSVKPMKTASAYLRSTADTRSLPEKLKIGNMLTTVQAKLDSLKQRDETTGAQRRGFKVSKDSDSPELGSDTLHSAIKDIHRRLSGVVTALSSGSDSDYGVGSPIHPEEMKLLGSRIEAGLPTSDKQKLPGEPRKVTVSVKRGTRKVPVFEPGRGGHTYIGEEEISGPRRTVTAQESTQGPLTPEQAPVAAKTREAVTKAAKTGKTFAEVKEAGAQAKSAAAQGLYDQALGHMREGRRIPPELRAQMHPTAVTAVLKQARSEREPK